MSKTTHALYRLLAHAKSADHHLRRCKDLARAAYEYGLAEELEKARTAARAATAVAQLKYGAAVTAAVRRIR